MKRNQSDTHRPLLRVLGTVVLTAALVAGPGLTGLASAVEPVPAPTSDTTAAPGPTSSPAVSTPAPAPASEPSASTTAAPTPAPSPTITNESMAEAVGIGGAEMGQRSARVAASTSSTSFKKLSTEALGTEGTWMPTFGVQGLDVSGHQPSVDWQHQWNMGARFAYVKASEGNYYTNPSYSSQYQGSRSVGMIRGAYHFAIPNWSSGADQARYFVQNGGGWSADGYTMPPVLDFEFNPYEGRTINGFFFGNTCYGMSPAQLSSWVRDFGSTMQSLTGRLPVIYTNTSWWNQCLGNPSGFGDYPLWVAAYPSSPTNNAGPVPTASWSTYSIWQYSSTGPLAGDSNVWNGDQASLQRFAGAQLPTGSFDELAQVRTGSDVHLRARGWAVDRSKVSVPSDVHIYVTDPSNVTTGYAFRADTNRSDVDQALGYGAWHGFDSTIRITSSGTYKACAYAIGTFGNTPMGCKNVQAVGVEPPLGSFDTFAQVRTSAKVSLRVTGWAIDRVNASTSTWADIYVTGPDGTTKGYRRLASTLRPDVDTVFGFGANHGFDELIDVQQSGTYKACIFSIGQYSNTSLGCQQILISANPKPIGSYDEISITQTPGAARLQVRGWALDPTAPEGNVPVHVYVQSPDGSNTGYAFTANSPRPDVTQALKTVGDHGFQVTVDVNEVGAYTVCAYAIPIAPISAGNSSLGCKSIRVTKSPAPSGYLDAVKLQTSNGQVSAVAEGWGFDPAIPAASIPTHIYVTYPDGSQKGFAFTANKSRPDVNNAFGITGDHGFSASLSLVQRGQYNICAYAVGIAEFSAGNPLLGCRTVSF